LDHRTGRRCAGADQPRGAVGHDGYRPGQPGRRAAWISEVCVRADGGVEFSSGPSPTWRGASGSYQCPLMPPGNCDPCCRCCQALDSKTLPAVVSEERSLSLSGRRDSTRPARQGRRRGAASGPSTGAARRRSTRDPKRRPPSQTERPLENHRDGGIRTRDPLNPIRLRGTGKNDNLPRFQGLPSVGAGVSWQESRGLPGETAPQTEPRLLGSVGLPAASHLTEGIVLRSVIGRLTLTRLRRPLNRSYSIAR
jgi:hypothetical protein